MFFLHFSAVWSTFFLFYLVYVLFVFLIVVYLLPITKDLANFSSSKKIVNFSYVTGFDLYWLLITPLALISLNLIFWTGPTITCWFGHLVFTSFQLKVSGLIVLIFFAVVTVYSTSIYFSSREVYDYVTTCFNMFCWILLIFCSNSLFTVLFFIELLSTLVFMLLVTSAFSTTHYYNNLNLNLHSYFHSTTPVLFLQMLMYFFWVSLISSLNLFVFLILFYTHFFTLDWFLTEHFFFFLINDASLKELFSLSLIWLNLVFCIFLKCGLVPFYFWKPTFFKGLPIHALMFYVTFFYFFLFNFFLYFFLANVSEIFFFFAYVNICFLLVGVVFLLALLCEAYYIKVFFAMSSIINSLFVFLALTSGSYTNFLLVL